MTVRTCNNSLTPQRAKTAVRQVCDFPDDVLNGMPASETIVGKPEVRGTVIVTIS